MRGSQKGGGGGRKNKLDVGGAVSSRREARILAEDAGVEGKEAGGEAGGYRDGATCYAELFSLKRGPTKTISVSG